jgi:hypothetical protein
MHVLTRALHIALMALAATLAVRAPAAAEGGQPAGIVTAVYGTATVSRASLAPRALKFRDDVMLRDRIATGDESLARILLGGKAVITVRERSVVTITESPRVSTVDVESGKIALAVAKERMRPGESIELRTPNAVAGIRGTVVIAEVTRQGGDVSTRFTLLTGVIEVLRLDAARRPIGAASVLNPLQTISVDRVLSPVRPITGADGQAASAPFGLPATTRPRGGADWVAKDQVARALASIDADRGRGVDLRPDVKPDQGGKADPDDRPDRMKLPVGSPLTPLVPSSALQPGKIKNKGNSARR